MRNTLAAQAEYGPLTGNKTKFLQGYANLVLQLVRHCRQQAMLGDDGRSASVHHRKCTSPYNTETAHNVSSAHPLVSALITGGYHTYSSCRLSQSPTGQTVQPADLLIFQLWARHQGAHQHKVRTLPSLTCTTR